MQKIYCDRSLITVLHTIFVISMITEKVNIASLLKSNHHKKGSLVTLLRLKN